FGGSLGITRRIVSHPGYNAGAAFGGSVVDDLPYMLKDPNPETSPLAVVAGGGTPFFHPSGTTYKPPPHPTETPVHYVVVGGMMLQDAYKLTDTAGGVTEFWGWGNGVPTTKRGKLKSRTDPNGNVINATYDTSGVLTELTRTSTAGGTTTTESLLFVYNLQSQVSTATLRRQVGAGPWATIRKVDYTYGSGGVTLAEVKDAAGTVLETRHYRISSTGIEVFGPEAYERLMAAYPGGATDAQAAAFADLKADYDSVKRVTTAALAKAGCSACAGGIGTSTFTYKTSVFANGYNSWQTKTVETLPGGNQKITHANFAGEAMLAVDKEVGTGQEWRAAPQEGRLRPPSPAPHPAPRDHQ